MRKILALCAVLALAVVAAFPETFAIAFSRQHNRALAANAPDQYAIAFSRQHNRMLAGVTCENAKCLPSTPSFPPSPRALG